MICILLSGCSSTIPEENRNKPQITVNPELAKKALNQARKKKGYPYEWGADGPNRFDCSGLVVHSYQKALKEDYIFKVSQWITNDATMNDLYQWNVKLIPLQEARAGDILFFTREVNNITHGALFIEWISYKQEFRYIHSSSSRGQVAISTWEIKENKGDYWLEGIGRLKLHNN